MAIEEEDGRSRALIVQFPGLKLRMDEYKLFDGGSHDQVNVFSRSMGTLEDRGGFLVCTFEGE